MEQENQLEMMQYTSAELLDKKAAPLTDNIFKAAFEFLLAGVCKAHAKAKRLDFHEFNEKNELQRSLLLTYPFFVSLSNGHGNSLYNLFGNFLTYTYGPASIPVRDLLPRSSEAINLDFFVIKPTKVEIKGINNVNEGQQDFKSFDELAQKIKLKKVTFENRELLLSQVAVQKDNTPDIYSPLCDLISKGIEIIKDRAGDNFFDGNTKRVLDLASQFDAWKQPYQEGRILTIEYKDIAKQPAQKRPFFSLEYA